MSSRLRSLQEVGDLISQWLRYWLLMFCAYPSSEKGSQLNGDDFALEVILSSLKCSGAGESNSKRLGRWLGGKAPAALWCLSP